MNYKSINKNLGKLDGECSVVLKGPCPFCGNAVTFRQIGGNYRDGSEYGTMIALQCEGCRAVTSFNLFDQIMYPALQIQGLEDLPEGIAKYYDEALVCLSAGAPNGAATLFRKTIHALGIYYGVAEMDDNKNLHTIIRKLHDDGHIVAKIREALLRVKDIGNDGAHVNSNEPDMAQALCLKELIDVALNSTVNCDKAIAYAENKHKCNP